MLVGWNSERKEAAEGTILVSLKRRESIEQQISQISKLNPARKPSLTETDLLTLKTITVYVNEQEALNNMFAVDDSASKMDMFDDNLLEQTPRDFAQNCSTEPHQSLLTVK